VNKSAASVAQLANCILLPTYLRTIAVLIAGRAQTKTSYSLFN